MNNKNIEPPGFPLWCFRLFCDPAIVEDIEGDLVERFELRAERKGHGKARWLLMKDVLQLFRPGIIRTFKGFQKRNRIGMYKNYFKIAFRNLLKQKMYSTIKTGGFAMGIAACLLISLYIQDELSYDQHYEHQDRLYRVTQQYSLNGSMRKQSWMPAAFAKSMTEELPQVAKAGRIRILNQSDIRLKRAGTVQNSLESGFAYADSTILELLEIDLLLGDKATALRESNGLILSQRKAEKFFPGTNPIGETMIINGNESFPFTITGVMAKPSNNSHFEADYLLSLSNVEFFRGEINAWGANNYQVYAQLNPGVKASDVEQAMHLLAEKYVLPVHQRRGNVNAEEFVAGLEYELQPIQDIRLHSDSIRDPFEHANVRFIWLFGAVAGLILMIAVTNFINLSTAKSANRAKEVGLRKAIGSGKGDLVIQFLVESVLFSFIAFALGLLLAWLLLPFFNSMADKSLILPFSAWWFTTALFVAALTIGIVAGIYPAFYLSSFRPIQVLKGSLSLGSKKSGLRSALVVFQFTTSIALIIATLVVGRQMQFIMNTELGFDKEQVITLSGTRPLGEKITALKNELTAISGVENVSISGYLPVEGTSRNSNLFWHDGRVQQDEGSGSQIWRVDYDYINTLGIQITDGRNFSRELATDTAAIIVNEQFVKDFDLIDPIGKKVTNDPQNQEVYTIVGVIDDFHYESLKGEVEALGLILGNNQNMMSLRVNTEEVTDVLASVIRVWDNMAPEQPIAYDFLSDRFALMYADVSRTGSIFTSFAVFAVFVACLGLFGLSVFMVEQRNKEISIRLVLGASVKNILASLGFNFLKPVIIALFIAIPIAWYAMKDWLSEFEYKTALSWDIFVIAGIAAIAIAVLTVSYQSLKAAVMKPVNGLRSE